MFFENNPNRTKVRITVITSRVVLQNPEYDVLAEGVRESQTSTREKNHGCAIDDWGHSAKSYAASNLWVYITVGSYGHFCAP
jgi:hypothetical protein